MLLLRLFFPCIIVFLGAGCGARKVSSTTTNKGNPIGGSFSSACPPGMVADTATPMGTACIAAPGTCVAGTVCATTPQITCPLGTVAGSICAAPISAVGQNSPLYAGIMAPGDVSATGPVIPTSYTFLATPNANLCVDAFYRAGLTLPSNATAKTLKIRTTGSQSIVSDILTTTLPVLTIIDAAQCNSTLFLQLLNKNGFYCMVGMDSLNSQVTIQKSCAAQIASIEPQTISNQPAKVVSYNLWWFWPHREVETKPSNGSFFGGYSSAGSSVSEVPCIP